MGQEMLVSLAQLAYNLVMRAKEWLAELEPGLTTYRVQRWVRDLFAIAGQIVFEANRIIKVQLNRRNRLA